MELKNVFAGTAVMLVGVIAILTWINGLNTAYGTNVGSEFNTTLAGVQSLSETNLQGIAVSVGNNTQAPEGAGESDAQQGIFKRSLSTLGSLDDLLGLIPSIIGDFGNIADVPEVYLNIAKWTFIFTFGLTIMYLLLLGAQRIFG